MMRKSNLEKIAALRRAELLTMIRKAGTGHTGGALSSVDILVALYYEVMKYRPEDPYWPDRDRFILSKGHSVEGLLCILADRGFFPKAELNTFSQYLSRLIGHPTNKIPGIEICSGALGHGLSVGVGMALGAKRSGKSWKTYVLMGDGELAEGSVWEGAMAASHYQLDNLTAVIDRNRLQISGDTETVMSLENLAEKWESFGWNVAECDGHDIDQLIEKIAGCPLQINQPSMIIAKTTKGKGVANMENVAKWHHGVPSEEQLRQALVDLGVEEVTL
jgi:transketolase